MTTPGRNVVAPAPGRHVEVATPGRLVIPPALDSHAVRQVHCSVTAPGMFSRSLLLKDSYAHIEKKHSYVMWSE